MPLAVAVEDVAKRFRLYHDKYTSLKERALHLGKVPFEEFWAVDGVSLELEQGRTLGLLGRNGSGKSTLLKCIAGILQPTRGRIVVRGQLAAMLELGAGFHPELSGRDNIFLNASLLGMPRREIERRFDDIVAFAELEQFIDNQVKYYSSGMYTRLGFAVAVNVEPDVLLIDEVLAVGDEAFQRKCIDRVKQFQKEGRTIVLVTHAAEYVRQICDWAVVLNAGRVIANGAPGETIRAFREELAGGGEADHGEEGAAGVAHLRPGWKRVVIDAVEVEHPGVGSRNYVLAGEPLAVRARYHTDTVVAGAVFGMTILDARGETVYRADTQMLGQGAVTLEGAGEVIFRVGALPLLDGAFEISLGVTSEDGGDVYDLREQCARFEVVHPGQVAGYVDLGVAIEVITRTRPDRTALVER